LNVGNLKEQGLNGLQWQEVNSDFFKLFPWFRSLKRQHLDIQRRHVVFISLRFYKNGT